MTSLIEIPHAALPTLIYSGYKWAQRPEGSDYSWCQIPDSYDADDVTDEDLLMDNRCRALETNEVREAEKVAEAYRSSCPECGYHSEGGKTHQKCK